MVESFCDAPSLRESPRPEPDEWLQSGEYLPAFMRDFHDQKDLFKAIDEVVERGRAKALAGQGLDHLEGVTWVNAHVYTVDFFLWCLARRGWTLQRSRKRLQFADIYEFTSEAMQRWRSQAAEVLGLAMQGNRKDGSSQQNQNPQVKP